jgi:hypothetical protein
MGSKSKKNKKNPDLDTNVPYFKSSRVFLTPKGDLLISLPIYVNEVNGFFDESEKDQVTRMITLGLGVFEHVGFIVYHPEVGEMIMKNTATKIFEDLGEL